MSSFCVIGAGAAGISAALALRDLGHEHVCVYDENDTVGGKCRTSHVEGRELDIGAIYILPHYPRVRRLVERAGSSVYEAPPFVHAGADSSLRTFGQPKPPFTERALEFMRIGRALWRCRDALLRPLGELDEDTRSQLALPFSEWVRAHRLEYFHGAAYPLLRSFGFGYEEQEIPAAYVVNSLICLARGGNPLSLWDPSTVRLFHIDGGYGTLWRRLARPLELRLGAPVTKVERKGPRIRVLRGDEASEFDTLIIACPLSRAIEFLDCTPEELELFSKVRSFDVWQSTVRIVGIPDAVLIDQNQVWSRRGQPMIALRYHRDSDWYYVFGYADEGFAGSRVVEAIRAMVDELGGRIVAEPHVRLWRGYFPHFGTAEFLAGYHARLEALQGARSTYYVGEVMSNIGVEAVTRYSQRLMRRCFPVR